MTARDGGNAGNAWSNCQPFDEPREKGATFSEAQVGIGEVA